MVRWHLTRAKGSLAGVPLAEIMDNGGVLTSAPCETPVPGAHVGEHAWLEQHLGRIRCGGRPTWVILPDRARSETHHWQDLAGNRVELGFGRAGITLALGQINRLQAPATLVALDRLPGSQTDTVVESCLQLDLEPAQTGLGLAMTLVDGRLDGHTKLTALLEKARAAAPAPDVLMMPGTGSDASLDRLLASLPAMGNWVGRDMRWEFAEARIGPLGCVGSLFNWYWLYEGFRLGDWQGTAVILDMDTTPLVGLSVVDFTA